jgi:hypothetical protein
MKWDLWSRYTNANVALDECTVGGRDCAGSTGVGCVANGQTTARGGTIHTEFRLRIDYSDPDILAMYISRKGQSHESGADK